jgi:hypothetical protein
MAGALMGGRLRRVFRAVDAGLGIALERNGRCLAPGKSLFGRSQLGLDPALLMGVPAPHEQKAGTGGKQKKDLRHG